ncbi:hypothetical protein PVAND_000423 [Polypedilum vanderplanki]|uniref:RING-type domain-containing protein n=1 Tax=Polypedilum vanderplanki TaxID=319348 RepID=A0A9J6BK20_POLVA|nr:hypothetical protein PVAND_000423 [Polypedilum vanderplanki]
MNISSQTGQEIDLKRVENRLRTFDNWPIGFIDKSDLANAGFYYLNNSDQVRCVECGGVIGQWEQGDVPLLEHKKFFPNCPIVRQYDNEEIGIQPASLPKYPEYSTIESRIRSFSNWASAAQDSARLAQAGFYYLGNCDEVRCFSCDGGLRNWLEQDDPWFEHARWFPKCPFVKLVKGSAYIKNVLQRIQNTNQNQITASAPTALISIDDAMSSQPAIDALEMGLNVGRVRVVMQRRLQLTGRPFTSTEALVAAVLDGQIADEEFDQEQDPETEVRIQNQVTELLLSAVNSVAFNNTNSRDIVEQHPSTSSEVTSFSNVRPIVPENSNNSLTRVSTNELLRTQERATEKSENTLEAKSTTTVTASDLDERRLKNVECKICMTEEVGVVFLPCGHLLSCVYCAPALTQCPLCREIIRGRVRTFLS